MCKSICCHSKQVRRAALQAQLDRDYRQYEEEFHNQGKAFYIKRT